MTRAANVTNTVNITHERDVSILEDEIVEFALAARRLLATDPATRKAAMLLIAHLAKAKEKDVRRALEAAASLGRKYAPAEWAARRNPR